MTASKFINTHEIIKIVSKIEKLKLFQYLTEEDKRRLVMYTLSGHITLQDIFSKYSVTEEEFYLLKQKVLDSDNTNTKPIDTR